MTRTDPTRRRLRNAPLPRYLASLLVGLMLAPPVLWAGPSGENVVAGTATVARDGTDTTITAGNRSIIEWDNFDIGVNESVQFIQPNRRARVLNRVVGPNATHIEGALRANGNVYILNQYGVFFADTAVVEVAHLVAAAGHLANEDFLSGVDRFTELGGTVENLGRISGKTVTLLGKSVANHGSISATNGRIWMVAGDEVIIAEHGSPIVLTIGVPSDTEPTGYAVENTGDLDAGNRGAVRMAAGDLLSLAIHNSGTIRARNIALAGGEGSRVQVGGTLDASNTLGGPVRDGGTIDIRGDYVFVDDATLDASGRRGGGTVHIGGDVQGVLDPGSSERNSLLTYISDDSVIRADALLTGDGGEIVAWSDGATFVDGQLSARGADRRGNGGFVETSGKQYLSADVLPDLAAPNGNGGSWLIDPANIDIVAAATIPEPGDLTHFVEELATTIFTSGSPAILPEVDVSQIEADTLEAALGQGFNITISTARSDGSAGALEGNIVFQEGLDFNTPNTVVPGTSATLTLLAANRIVLATNATPGGANGIDDTSSPNLDLSVFMRAGDTSQVQQEGFAYDDGSTNGTLSDPNANESILLEEAISIRGTLDLGGEDIHANKQLTAGAMNINGRHAVTTGRLASTGGDIIIRSEAGSTQINGIGGGGGSSDVETEGGNFGITAIGGDILFAGDIDLRTDTTDTAPDADGGAIGFVSIPVPVEGQAAGDGGNILLSTVNATDQILAPSGVGIDAGGSLDIQQDVVTHNGAATFRVTDNLAAVDITNDDGDLVEDVPFVLGNQTLTLQGDVTSNGGLITIESTQAVDQDPSDATGPGDISVNVDIQGDLNALDTLDPTSHGGVNVSTSGDVLVRTNVAISADNVLLAAGLDGTGDLTFEGAATISARSTILEAGDGFSPELFDDGLAQTAIDIADQALQLDSQIAGLNGITLQGNNNDDLDTVLLLQDGNFATSDLPTIDFGTSVEPALEINSRDRTVHVEVGTLQGVLPADTQLFLVGAGGDRGPAFILDEQLDFDSVDLGAIGSLNVDTALASMASGAGTSQLRIAAGLGGILPNDGARQPTFIGVPGGLIIEDNVSLAASEVLELHGAVSGVGGDPLDPTVSDRGLQFGTGVTLSADDITIRAGDGVGGPNFSLDSNNNAVYPRISDTSGGAPTDLTIQNAGTGPLRFTYRQEAAIGPNDLPGVDDADSVVHYTAISDEGDISFDDTTVVNESGLLTNQDVTLAARNFDLDALTVPIVTRSLDLGGILDLDVDNTLLSHFDYGSNDLTLRAGTGTGFAGILSFATGTTVSADSIRLVASDGLGGAGTSTINVSGATFTAADINPLVTTDTDLAPTTFIMEQDADLLTTALPSEFAFGDGVGPRTPATVALRSVDGALLLDDLPGELVGAAGKLLLAGALVRIGAEDGDLDLSAINDLEIRADQISLRAASSDDTDFANNYNVIFGANNKFFGYDTEADGNEDGDLDLTPLVARGLDPNSLAPEVFTVQQDGEFTTTTASALPDLDLFGQTPESNDAILYRIFAEENSSIDLGDETKVAGTSLELRLLSYDVDDGVDRKIELTSPNTYVLQGLDISVPEQLAFNGVDIDAVGLVRLESGTLGVPDGTSDLIFTGTNSIRATEIRLFAGLDGQASIDATTDGTLTPPDTIGKAGLAKLDISGGTLNLTLDEDDPDLDTALSIIQDGDLDSSVALANGFTALTPTGRLERLTLASRRGNLDVEIGDVTDTDTLFVSAGTNDVQVDDTEDFGTLTVLSSTGDLELGQNSTAHMTAVQLSGNTVALRAESAGARLNLNRDVVSVFGGADTLPLKVILSQDAPLLADPTTNLLQADQFTGNVLGLGYELESASSDFLVDAALADQLSAFSLTLNNVNNTTRLDSSLAGAQRFFGLHAKSNLVEVDTAEFATISSQIYEAPVEFMRTSDLISLLDVIFTDTVQAQTGAGSVDARIFAARRVQFAEGVGSLGAGLNPAAAGNQLNDLSVFLLDQGEVEFGAVATGDFADVGELADALDPTKNTDTGVYLQGDLTIHTIDQGKFVQSQFQPALVVDPIPRKPGSNVATVYKRGIGTLQIVANDVSLGAVDPGADLIINAGDTVDAYGEKLTVLGRLDIDATGDVVVGDLTATDIEIDANSITVLRRPGGGVRAPGGGVSRDGGVDWVANNFQLTTTSAADELIQLGRGQRLVIGTSGARPSIDGVLVDAPVFALKPNHSQLLVNELLFDTDGIDPQDGTFNADTVVLDGRPRGPSAADLSDAIPEDSPTPNTDAPHGDQVIASDAFSDVGIITRSATGREYASRADNRGIYDDASRAWRSDREVASLTATRLDIPNASEAKRLFGEVFGANMSKAAGIRAVLAQAVADYRSHTGVRRVLGFELRRFLKNRPSTQFEAYQILEALDELFSAHRRSGLVPGEYTPVQRAWVEAIAPVGITPDELSEAIQPSRYVRGSDVLDVFGD